MIEIIIAGVSAAIALGSLFYARLEWRKVNRKIAMVSDASRFGEILPAWYTHRMGDEHWMFGLITTSGRTLAIKRILAVSDDAQWMDVELATPDEALPEGFEPYVIAVDEQRTTASVQISEIVAAVDLWGS